MEKGLNIAAILNDKPVGLKFYSPTFGRITFNGVHKGKVYFFSDDTNSHSVKQNGKMYDGGECIIFPSNEMRDWSRFSWKKGDVLQISDIGFCTFETWASDDYTTFKGKYCVGLGKNIHHDYISKKDLTTSMWYKVEDKSLIKDYLNTVEKRLGGKLNLETLQIESPKQEFKDGDILSFDGRFIKRDILVFEKVEDGQLYSRILLKGNGELFPCKYNFNINIKWSLTHGDLRLATESEKKQLFDALAKGGKKWNPDTLQIEDLPKKCEFKPFDKVLVRDK